MADPAIHDEILSQWYPGETLSAQKIRLNELIKDFHHHYSGRNPSLVATAPGRTELAGNHTDHNHGLVLAGAVDLDVLGVAALRDDNRILLHSRGWEKPFEVNLESLSPKKIEEGTTEALIRGVAGALSHRGYLVGGWEGVMDSTVLPGSGLSSSAAVEVFLGTVFNGLYNEGRITPVELAQTGQEAENRWFHKPCGLMDQMASALGGITQIDFQDPGKPVFNNLSFDFSTQGWILGVVDTGGSHAELTPQYAAVPGEMKALANALGKQHLRDVEEEFFLKNISALRGVHGDRAILRALHFYGENLRVPRMVEALKQDNLSHWFSLVKESGSSSWRLLQNVIPSGAVMDQEVALALGITEVFLNDQGACRVHGGGFAGTIQVYIPEGRWDEFVKIMEDILKPGCVKKLRLRTTGTGYFQL